MASSQRDNFPKSVVRILSNRVGGKCSICKTPTYGPQPNPDDFMNIGEAAHITAAAPGGPRYDPSMTSDVRSSATNGIWLCRNCHAVIDRDDSTYSVADLIKIKRDAEEQARREMPDMLAKDHDSKLDQSLASCVSAAAIIKIHKYKSHLAQLNNHITEEEGQTYLNKVDFITFKKDSHLPVYYLPDVGKELLVYLHHLFLCCNSTSVQMEVIRRVNSMCQALKNEFGEEEVKLATSVAKTTIERNSQDSSSKPFQSAVAFLKDLVVNFHEKGLQTAPNVELRRLRDQEKADTTIELEPPAKRPRITTDVAIECMDKDKTKEVPQLKREMSYLELMEALTKTKCTDIEQILSLEHKLLDMGYEPNII